ncbi:hypothetical protein [Amycolatopsis sp. NPDC059021]|uniref:hypothetical protein n=1 Tax=Amycolatopsis sp. NPDC059021 TaxID=3346704 RepID=UPI00366CD81A
MGTVPHRRSGIRIALAGIMVVLLLSAQREPRQSGFPLDAVVSGLAFALTGASRTVAVIGHLIAAAAAQGTDR